MRNTHSPLIGLSGSKKRIFDYDGRKHEGHVSQKPCLGYNGMTWIIGSSRIIAAYRVSHFITIVRATGTNKNKWLWPWAVSKKLELRGALPFRFLHVVESIGRLSVHLFRSPIDATIPFAPTASARPRMKQINGFNRYYLHAETYLRRHSPWHKRPPSHPRPRI
jgi:hypothetical protein